MINYSKIQRNFQRFFLSFGVFLIIVWCIVPLRKLVSNSGWVDENFILSILAVCLSLVLINLERIDRVLRKIEGNNSISSDDKLVKHGVAEVYPFLIAEMENVTKMREKKLRVLGLSLYTAWPNISAWLRKNDPLGWEIELCIIDPQYAKESGSIKDEWSSAAESQLHSIETFIEKNICSGVEIRVIKYRSLPVIHGFEIGSGAVFLSACQWDVTREHLDDPVHFYHYYSPRDISNQAELSRDLFRSWFDRALVTEFNS